MNKNIVLPALLATALLASAANAASVSIGTGAAQLSSWTASFTPTPGFGGAAPVNPGTPSVVQYYNSAWTGAAAVAAAAPSYGLTLADSDWISTKFQGVSEGYAYNGLITYGIDLGLTVSAGDAILYGFSFTSDNRVTSVKLVDGITSATLYNFDLPAIAPAAGDDLYHEFKSSVTVPAGAVLSPGSSVKLQVTVFNEGGLDSQEMTNGYFASPTGLMFAGQFEATPIERGNPVPVPAASLGGSVLAAVAFLRRRRA